MTEMTTIHNVPLQNRLTLDFTLSCKGEICTLTGKGYFTSIPDNSENIFDLNEHIKKEAHKAKQPSNWNLWSSFENIKKCWVDR